MAWKTFEAPLQGCVLTLTGKPAYAVQMIRTGIAELRSIGVRVWIPFYLSFSALGYAKLSQLAEAWRCVEALTEIRTSKEKWFEAELNRVAGEIALMASKPDTLKAQAYLECALTVARDQQAKSWELRAALSMARLGRDQGKRNDALDLLTAVHGWFSEGFEALDLRQANDPLNTLRAGPKAIPCFEQAGQDRILIFWTTGIGGYYEALLRSDYGQL